MAKERLQVLIALDATKTQWYRFTAIIIAIMGTKLHGRIYYHVNGA